LRRLHPPKLVSGSLYTDGRVVTLPIFIIYLLIFIRDNQRSWSTYASVYLFVRKACA